MAARAAQRALELGDRHRGLRRARAAAAPQEQPGGDGQHGQPGERRCSTIGTHGVPSSGAAARRPGSDGRSPPRLGGPTLAPGPEVAPSSLGCERAGAAAGVGSKVTQPMPRYQTSTHEWASRSRTTYSLVLVSSDPEVKPVTTRVGTPAIRSSSAIAPENCWQ